MDDGTVGLILVTGAAGKTGRAVLRQLAARGVATRALVRRGDQSSTVRAAGAGEVTVGDLLDRQGVRAAAAGATVVYHICPNMSRDEEAIGEIALEAARGAGARIVYHSVLMPEVEAMPHHWRKAKVEERIRSSGLAFAILRPTAYMQNVLQQRRTIVEHGVYPVPYAQASVVSLVDLEDVAVAAAHVLLEDSHDGGVYELCADELLDQAGIADALTRQLGRPVTLEVLDRPDWAAGARRAGLEEEVIGDLLRMFEYYERHGMTGSPDQLASLLGRRPTSFAEFLKREF